MQDKFKRPHMMFLPQVASLTWWALLKASLSTPQFPQTSLLFQYTFFFPLGSLLRAKPPHLPPKSPVGPALLSGALPGVPPPPLAPPAPRLHSPHSRSRRRLTSATPATRPPTAVPLPHMMPDAQSTRRTQSSGRGRERAHTSLRGDRRAWEPGGRRHDSPGYATAEPTPAFSASRTRQQLPPGSAPRRAPRRRRRLLQVPLGVIRAAHAQIPPPRTAPGPTQALACWQRRRGTRLRPHPPVVPGAAWPPGEQQEGPCQRGGRNSVAGRE